MFRVEKCVRVRLILRFACTEKPQNNNLFSHKIIIPHYAGV